MAWHYGKSGIFSVKSVYNLALNLKESRRRILDNLVVGRMEIEDCGMSFGILMYLRILESLHGMWRLIVW